jgi:hypothetical protein
MKPHRIRMTHNLLLNYGLYRKMEIYRPHKANAEEMTKYHSDDYIKFLRSIRPDNMSEYSKQMQRCKYVPFPSSRAPHWVFFFMGSTTLWSLFSSHLMCLASQRRQCILISSGFLCPDRKLQS